MKSKKGFFILLAVFLVLVVCYLALKVWTEKAQEEEQAKTEAEQIYLTDTDVSEITSFGYSNGETELSFVKEEDTWYSETDREVNLNQSSVENMLSQIAYISADRKLEDPDGLADYGLEDSVYTLWYTTESGETVTVLVGNAAGSNYYAMEQDGSEVYTVSGSCIESLYFDLEDLKEEEETEETDTTEEADVSDGSDISTDTQESE